MPVSVVMSDEDYLRIKFDRFLAHNRMSAVKNEDGTYYSRHTQNMWVAFVVGFRTGRESAGGTCEF